RQPQDLPTTVGEPDAADLRCPHRIVFLTLLPLRLATTPRSATRTTERAGGTAAPTTATGTTAEAAAPCGRPATGTETAAAGTSARAAGTATSGRRTRHLAGHLA